MAKGKKMTGSKADILARADAAMGVMWMPTPTHTDEGPHRQTLAELQSVVESAFPFCEGLSAAKKCVFGEGAESADVVFVGEAPGAEEDRQGRPFVGPAGKKLDEIIQAMCLTRSSVYICNVLKARPPENRTPLPDEVASQYGYLAAQLRIIRPQVIVALGGPASSLLLDTKNGITRLRGRMGHWQDPESPLQIPVMPTFHPAYILRNYTPEVRQAVWSDMQQVMALLAVKP